MHEPLERRAAQRFAVQVPVTIWDVGGQIEISGTTRDVSSRGVFFFVDSWPPHAHSFQFMLTISALDSGLAQDLRVFCSGTAVRVERGFRRQVGVAAAIQRYRLGGLPR